jgi:hypothetical protein
MAGMNPDPKVDWPAYIETMTVVHALPLSAERRAAVLQQMNNIEVLAQRFLDFPLEAEVEIAPVFRP